MQVSYLGSTNAITGSTSLNIVTLGQTITKYHTLVAFVVCHDTGLTPTVNSDWDLVLNVDGISGSTFVYINQPTGTTVNPTYTVGGLSPQLNAGMAFIFSGCSYHSSNVVNAVVGRSNIGSNRGTDGFDTTAEDTMIIQFVGLFQDNGVSDFVSSPSLVWTERKNTNFIYGGYDIRIAGATSSLAPKGKYTQFSYTLETNSENITIDVALTPRRGNVMMSMGTI